MKLIKSGKVHVSNEVGKSLCGQSPWTNEVEYFDGSNDVITCERCLKSIKVYEVQSYIVKFDLGPVDVNINVYHEDKTELTRDEILEEALGYAEDAGIWLNERDLLEIKTVEKN